MIPVTSAEAALQPAEFGSCTQKRHQTVEEFLHKGMAEIRQY